MIFIYFLYILYIKDFNKTATIIMIIVMLLLIFDHNVSMHYYKFANIIIFLL